MAVTVSGIVKLVNLEQPLNASLLTAVKPEPIVTLDKLEKANTPSPMVKTVSGIVISLKPPLTPDRLNAESPISWTLSGIVTLVRLVVFTNALFPIAVKPLRKVKDSKPTHSSKTLAPQLVTPLPIVMLVSDLHPLNAFVPREVTESEITRLVSAEQFRKALFPILVTESGIVRLVSLIDAYTPPSSTLVRPYGKTRSTILWTSYNEYWGSVTPDK